MVIYCFYQTYRRVETYTKTKDCVYRLLHDDKELLACQVSRVDFMLLNLVVQGLT